jgi:hypothetical protein
VAYASARIRVLARVAAVVCLALLVGGCAKVVYNRLDSLATWFIGSLVTLEPEQRHDVRAWLTQIHEWHRSSELTRYVQFLHGLADRVQAPGERREYEDVARQVASFADSVVGRATPEAARLLLTLTPAQVAELDANLDRRGRERAKESLERIRKGDWRAERARDLRRQLKRFTGAVTKEQQDIIEEAASSFEPTTEEWLESQRQWRKVLVDTLNEPRTPDLEQRVLALLQRPDAHWTQSYRTKNDRNREQSLSLIERLDQSLTPRQRERLRRELHDIARQLESLRRV